MRYKKSFRAKMKSRGFLKRFGRTSVSSIGRTLWKGLGTYWRATAMLNAGHCSLNCNNGFQMTTRLPDCWKTSASTRQSNAGSGVWQKQGAASRADTIRNASHCSYLLKRNFRTMRRFPGYSRARGKSSSSNRGNRASQRPGIYWLPGATRTATRCWANCRHSFPTMVKFQNF